MASSRQAPDRSAQKARTRTAIVDAAAAILRQGRQPTVAEAAAAAGVHRATAYRYFPTPQSLLADTALRAGTPDERDVFEGVDPCDPLALIDAAVLEIGELMFREEAMFRNIVRVTVDRWSPNKTGTFPTPTPSARPSASDGSITPSLPSKPRSNPATCDGSGSPSPWFSEPKR